MNLRPLFPHAKGRPWLAAFVSLFAGLVATPPARAVVTFDFQYADAAGAGFNDPNHPEYKAALVSAGQAMGSYFAHTATITMTVTSTNTPRNSTLATAGSGLISTNGSAGFFRTIVQAKVISNGAVDLNGADPDGAVNVNLGANFQYDPNAAVGANQVDFRATIIHELTHAFGFISYIAQDPNTQPTLYSTFDSFLTDSSGNPLINPGTYAFNPSETFTLTGGNSTLMASPAQAGQYFNGSNARAGFGGNPVPIFSPSPYQPGSSGSHTDDNTRATHGEIMNAAAETSAMAGAAMPRTYSAPEAGIMTDLGYTLAAAHASFFTGEVALQGGVYYLSFANGKIFGYYNYDAGNPRFVYHYDLGFEYWFEANDGANGVYFYDFKSGHFFYTSPTFGFPYLYDFSLQAFLYYYPDPANPQRYNTNGVRYFYNFSTGQTFSQ